jgi:serine/threonine-protein kinase
VKKNLAVAKLKANGFQVAVRTSASPTVAAGKVIYEIPNSTFKTPKGSLVTIYVSTGPAKDSVPALAGLTQAAALSTLENNNLVGKVYAIYSHTVPAGTVISQHPKAGTSVVDGSPVRINVSRGRNTVDVPSVVGEPYESGRSALVSAGFRVTREDVSSDTDAKGLVVSQDPLAGSAVSPNSNITLSVSKGPAARQIPDVRGLDQVTAMSVLRNSGYVPVVQSRTPVTDPSQDGIVLTETPMQGTLAPDGTVVRLTVGELTTTTSTTTTTTTTTPTGPTGPTGPSGP